MPYTCSEQSTCGPSRCTGEGVEKRGVILALRQQKVEHPLPTLESYTVTSNRYKCQEHSSIELYTHSCWWCWVVESSRERESGTRFGGRIGTGLACGEREMLLSKGMACVETPGEAGSMFCLGFREQVCQARAEVI